jgi:hypothetical protein
MGSSLGICKTIFPRGVVFSITIGAYLKAPASEPSSQPPLPATPQINQQLETAPQFGSCVKAKAAGFGPSTARVDPECEWNRDNDGAIYK